MLSYYLLAVLPTAQVRPQYKVPVAWLLEEFLVVVNICGEWEDSGKLALPRGFLFVFNHNIDFIKRKGLDIFLAECAVCRAQLRDRKRSSGLLYANIIMIRLTQHQSVFLLTGDIVHFLFIVASDANQREHITDKLALNYLVKW